MSLSTLRKKQRNNQQPFTITILGGQRKWYQSVADKFDIALIHDTGDHPERILHRLKRSKVMFLMVESVSHNATYMCVEFAKRHGIDIQRITGSKSQLKGMLLKRLIDEKENTY